MSELHRLTVSQLAARMQARELSPVDLVQACLDRIEKLEPRLRAWETVDRQGALAAARRAESEIARDGARGPLHGIPVGLKDIYYTAGLRTSMSSRVYANFTPGYDAASVARLRAAGAIVLGKTVTTEFATGDPPRTRNPWNPSHTPGGSSSGSAVAVAAGMCPVATGSQTAGSVNRPAAYNGVVGLKPTYGRVSRFGVFPVSWSLDTLGWMGRDVRDVAIVLDAVSGRDSRDPACARRAPTAATRVLDREDSEWTPRVGVAAEFFPERADRDATQNVNRALRALVAAGAQVDEFHLPKSFYGIHEAQVVIDYAECAQVHREQFGKRAIDYAPNVRARIECGSLIPASAYVQAQRLRRRLRADMEAVFSPFDVILTPATPAPAPRDLSTTGDPAFQAPWTTCGLPVLNIPTGLSEDGLPVGVQLIARGWHEETLLRAGRWAERVLRASMPEPPLAARKPPSA